MKILKNRNLQIIASIISSIAIIVTIIIFWINRNEDNERFINNLKIINCLNLEKANLFIPGKGQTWDYNIRYYTSFYHQNWSEIFKNLNYASSTIKYSSSTVSSYLNLVISMDSINIEIERSELQIPFYSDKEKGRVEVLNKTASSSIEIKNLFNSLGVSLEYCNNEVYDKN